ncbi:hypothetical protein V8F20_004422 [Naviculisporaceae sp. PSN 640]
MRLINAAFAFTALCDLSLGSLLIPSYLPDGVWSASLDDDEPVLTKIGDIPVHNARTGALRVPDGTEFNITRVETTSPENKRVTTGCTGHNVSPLHYFVGYVTAWNDCPPLLIPSRTVWLWYAGSAFWFVCNYRYRMYACYQSDMDITLDSVMHLCGDRHSGWDYLSTRDVSWGVENIGYGVC